MFVFRPFAGQGGAVGGMPEIAFAPPLTTVAPRRHGPVFAVTVNPGPLATGTVSSATTAVTIP